MTLYHRCMGCNKLTKTLSHDTWLCKRCYLKIVLKAPRGKRGYLRQFFSHGQKQE